MENNPLAVNLLNVPSAAYSAEMNAAFVGISDMLRDYTKDVQEGERGLHVTLHIPYDADQEGEVTPRKMTELAEGLRSWITKLIMDPFTKTASGPTHHPLAQPYGAAIQHQKLVYFGVFPKQSLVQLNDNECFIEFAFVGSALLLGK